MRFWTYYINIMFKGYGFSIGKLIAFLVLLNQDIKVNIKPHSRSVGRDNFDTHFSLNYLVC